IYPGWLPLVFAVGPLANDRVANYSHWDAVWHKPDIFAPEIVRGTPLEYAVSNPNARGASLAALHVLAAAVLILAADPTLKPSEVRRVLLDSADPVVSRKPKKTAGIAPGKQAVPVRGETAGIEAVVAPDYPLRLNIDAAIQRVRQRSLLTVARDQSTQE